MKRHEFVGTSPAPSRQVQETASPTEFERQSASRNDDVTGLCNHSRFQEMLTAESAGAASLVLLDVDRFHAFNESFGYAAGDQLLRRVGDALRSCLRAEDVVARFGGDEFAILLPGRDADHALAVAERARAAVEALGTTSRAVTASLGVATREAVADTPLLEDAATALSAAKAQGPNRIRHHRHLRQKQAEAGCKTACAPSPGGCLKCGPTAPSPKGAALLLGAQDADAAATLEAALRGTDFAVGRLGPIFVLNDVRRRLSEIGSVLKERLSPYTRSCVRGVYAPGGATTAEQALAAFVFAEPLNGLIEHAEHEWVRDALSDHWLFSVFHPILDPRDGAVFAQEALLRARDPESGGLYGAGQVIRACEALNLEHRLDQRARQCAIRSGAKHVAASAKLFINFLPNTIYDPEICLRTTMEAAAESGMALSRLVFEVVETEKIPDMDRLLQILDYYRSRGVGTAIDDMGAGFTSLQYITQLKPDYVKLDREFMLKAMDDRQAAATLQAIVEQSHQSGARVICEGIETEAQLSAVVGWGVDLVQGFLFAKPACPPQPATMPTAKAAA